METHAAEIAEAIGKDALLVELGSGTSTKTRVLLNHVQRPVAYVPVDIAREHLVRASESLQQEFPELEVLPVCADYSQPFHLPTPLRPFRQAVAYFPGSTIGNFHREDARRFLARVRRLLDGQGGLLIGVDLKKDPKVLHAAYNDAQGVTERFNKNMLNRLNRDAGTDFDAKKFQHYAYYNQNMGRIEMHLVSLEDQLVHLNGCSFGFRRGESIRTECSYKYHVEEFCILASGAGFECKRCWTDKNEYFAVFYMETV
jgi:dimethylhistidine N-methyltransferase